MKKEVKEAVQRVMSACLDLTEEGRYHAFCDYSAHVDLLSVRVLPASTKYVESEEREKLIDRGIYVAGDLARADAVASLDTLASELRMMQQEAAA